MIDAYTIGVSLNLTGDLNKVLGSIIKQFESLNTAVKKVQGSITNITSAIEEMAVASERVAAAWRSTVDSMSRARAPNMGSPSGGGGGSGPTGGGGGNGGGGGSFGPPYLPSGNGAYPRIAGAAAVGASMLRLGGPGGGGGSGLPPVNGIPDYPGAPGSRPARTPIAAHDLALAAAGFGELGYGILGFEGDALGAAGDVDNIRHQLLTKGVSANDANQTIEQARAIARNTPGLTTAQVAAAALDLKSALGGTENDPESMGPALTALPAFTKTMSVLNAIGKENGDSTFALAKAQEILGHLVDERTGGVSATALQSQLDKATQVAVSSAAGGEVRVDPASYLAMAKQLRVAGLGLNDDALYGTLPAVQMVLGGSRTGTGIAAMYRQFGAGTMTQAKFGEAQKLGLYDKTAHWAHGQVSGSLDHLENAKEFTENPVQWVFDTIIPALEKAGIKDRIAQAQYVARFASTAVGGGVIADVIASRAAIEKEQRNIKGAQTGDAAIKTLYDDNYTLQLDRFHASFHNFLVDIGTPLLKSASDGLDTLVSVFNKLGEWAHRYPETAHVIEVTATALGALSIAVAGGTFAAFMLGPMVRVASALTGYGVGTAAYVGASGLVDILMKLSGPLGAFAWVMKPSAANGADSQGRTEADILHQGFHIGPDGQPVANALDPNYSPVPKYGPRRDRDTPVPVIIQNTRDLRTNLSAGQARDAARATGGPTGGDIRMTPDTAVLGGGL